MNENGVFCTFPFAALSCTDNRLALNAKYKAAIAVLMMSIKILRFAQNDILDKLVILKEQSVLKNLYEEHKDSSLRSE